MPARKPSALARPGGAPTIKKEDIRPKGMPGIEEPEHMREERRLGRKYDRMTAMTEGTLKLPDGASADLPALKVKDIQFEASGVITDKQIAQVLDPDSIEEGELVNPFSLLPSKLSYEEVLEQYGDFSLEDIVHPAFRDPRHPDYSAYYARQLGRVPVGRRHMHPREALNLDAESTPIDLEAFRDSTDWLSPKERLFAYIYVVTGGDFNRALSRSGYSHKDVLKMRAFLESERGRSELRRLRLEAFDTIKMTSEELLLALADLARGDINDVIEIIPGGVTRHARLRLTPDGRIAAGHLVKELSFDINGNPRVKLHDSVRPLELLAKQMGLLTDGVSVNLLGAGVAQQDAQKVSLLELDSDELAVLEAAAEKALEKKRGATVDVDSEEKKASGGNR